MMIRNLFVAAFVGLVAPELAFAVDLSILPTERQTVWNPGVTTGIPSRTTVCATVNASTYGNGSSDATGGIQAAMDACPAGQVVQLSAGTFKISSPPLKLNKGITLRGAGPTSTILNEPDGGGQAVIVMGSQWPSIAGSTNLTANAVKGATSVTVASTSGLSVGQLVLIDKLTDSSVTTWANDCTSANSCRSWFSRTDRSYAQVMEIASISGSTVTFTTPFHGNYETSFNAQLSRFNASAVRGMGLENLKVQGGEGGDSGGNVYMELAMYSWVKNIESYRSKGGSIHVYYSLRNTVRDSYFHETKNPNPGGDGYGIDVSKASADNLIENNISWNFNKVMLMRASGGGNVFGYNYFEDGYGSGYKSIMETGINASHMTTPHYELFEGNEGFNLGGDARWGGSVYITFFRNHATTVRRSLSGLGLTDANDRAAVNLKAGHWYYSYIGNVLGYSGFTASPAGTSWTYENTAAPYQYSGGAVPIWKLGQGDDIGTGGVADAKVASTALRDGNYDYATNAVRWDRSAKALPNSLYLDAKPAFMASCTWPWVDPIGSTKLYTLPARARFDGVANTVCGGSLVPLSAPTNLQVQ